jgi:hypothetical protein
MTVQQAAERELAGPSGSSHAGQGGSSSSHVGGGGGGGDDDEDDGGGGGDDDGGGGGGDGGGGGGGIGGSGGGGFGGGSSSDDPATDAAAAREPADALADLPLAYALDGDVWEPRALPAAETVRGMRLPDDPDAVLTQMMRIDQLEKDCARVALTSEEIRHAVERVVPRVDADNISVKNVRELVEAELELDKDALKGRKEEVPRTASNLPVCRPHFGLCGLAGEAALGRVPKSKRAEEELRTGADWAKALKVGAMIAIVQRFAGPGCIKTSTNRAKVVKRPSLPSHAVPSSH